MSKHARINDEHCGDDHAANHVVIELEQYDGWDDFYIFRPASSGMYPWTELARGEQINVANHHRAY